MLDQTAQSPEHLAAGVASLPQATAAAVESFRRSLPSCPRRPLKPSSNRNTPGLDSLLSRSESLSSTFLIATRTPLLRSTTWGLPPGLPRLPLAALELTPCEVEAIPTAVLDSRFPQLARQLSGGGHRASAGGGIVMLLQTPATKTRLVLSRREFCVSANSVRRGEA